MHCLQDWHFAVLITFVAEGEIPLWSKNHDIWPLLLCQNISYFGVTYSDTLMFGILVVKCSRLHFVLWVNKAEI